MLTSWPGGLNITGRNAGQEAGITVIYGSSSILHMTIVPPCAVDLASGSPGSNRSEEFREYKYMPEKLCISWLRSHWYRFGSLRKIRSGL